MKYNNLIDFFPWNPTSTYCQSLNYDIIKCLEKETAQFIKKGNIPLCGDFSARTSNAPDFIMDDDKCPVHNSCNKIINIEI
jgi:hypothetical protein